MYVRPGGQPAGSASAGQSNPAPGVAAPLPLKYFADIYTLAELEVRRLRHDPTELLMRGVQPALWLLVFGQAMGRVRGMPTGPFSYLQFMTPGILAQSVVFIAIFSGISIIWERDMGLLQKMLAAPVARSALVLGKMVGAGTRAMSQAAVVLLLSLLIRTPLRWGVLQLLGVMATVMLGAAFFAGLSMAIAALVKTRERFMGIGQVITMPLFFASNALYPLEIMPTWLKYISLGNPLSYMVNVLRALLLTGAPAALPMDFGVLLVATVAMVALTTWLYPQVAT